jgi:hypothetical protein
VWGVFLLIDVVLCWVVLLLCFVCVWLFVVGGVVCGSWLCGVFVVVVVLFFVCVGCFGGCFCGCFVVCCVLGLLVVVLVLFYCWVVLL